MAELVDVEQCDRDAAGKLIGKIGLSWSGDMIRTGKSDEHDYVQAFARHRLTALRSANTVRPEGVELSAKVKSLKGHLKTKDAVIAELMAEIKSWNAQFIISSTNDTPAAVDRASVIEECAAYLDGYAGGHYMAKSCATVLRQVLLPTSGSTPDAESHACTNGVAEAQPADHLAQVPDAVAGEELADRLEGWADSDFAQRSRFGDFFFSDDLRQAAARLRGEGR